MFRFVFSVMFFFLISLSLFSSENYKQVKVYPNQNTINLIADLGIALDHAHRTKDGGISFFVSDTEYLQMQQLNIQMEVLIDDWYKYYSELKKLTPSEKAGQLNQTAINYGVKNFELGSMGGYYTLTEIYNKIEELLNNYPHLVGDLQILGESHEGREIVSFKVSVNPNLDEDEPEVLYTALHHAREPESMMQMFYFIQYLIDNYETNDEVNYLLNNRALYFIPVVNPDGYRHNENIRPDGGGMWRKNRSVNGNNTFGVDLNRNYGPYEYWNAPNGGSSTNPSSDTYRGVEPFSEPELVAIKDFLNNRKIRACLNYHTYSNLLIFPYGAIQTESPDSNIFREFTDDMVTKNNYLAGTDMQTVNYSTRGNSDDYMYDGEPGRDKIFAMTPEVGGFDDGFWPPEHRIIPLAEENLYPNLYYANIVGGYPVVIDMHISKEFLLPGDQVNIYPIVRNKGLDESGNFDVEIKSLNDFASVVSDNFLSFETLESQKNILSKGFVVEFSNIIPPAAKASFEFSIRQDGLLRRKDTLNVRIGHPNILFEDKADSLERYWVSAGVNDQWEKTSKYSSVGNYSYTNSRDGFYSNSSYTTLTLRDEIELTDFGNAFLYFQTRYHIENAYDGGFIEISSDGGSSWNVVGGNLSHPADNAFYFPNTGINLGDPIYYGSLFSWQQQEIDLSDFIDKNILIRFSFCSDNYRVIDGWYIDDIKIVSYDILASAADDEIQYKFSLKQNYPNPFNPTTSIEYEIAETDLVTLKIYDVLGREVKVLVNEILSPGKYNVNFDVKSNLSSGLYLYRLESGHSSQTRKMLLLK